MRFFKELPKVELIESHDEEKKLLEKSIRKKARRGRPLNILEAGCGHRWSLDLSGVQYTLTGVDINEDALEYRKAKDLNSAVVGDLRTVNIEECEYDVIYNSFVLEHIDGAEQVLNNFLRWLKPGGILILKVPDRNSVHGFIARVTPFWFHICYKKYIEKRPNAGKHGFAPFPTFYDRIVSRNGIHEFCKKHGLIIRAEWGSGLYLNRSRFFLLQINLFLKIFYFISLGRLASDYSDLTYVIEK